MKKPTLSQVAVQIATPLAAIASPQRIAILLSIGKQEACVCHLEASLGWRQAYISQHLMALRKAHILKDRREGKYIFYSLMDASLLEFIQSAAKLSGLSPKTISDLINTEVKPSCECPQCAPTFISVGNL